MGKLIAYNFVTLNGYFKGPNGDLSWHQHGEKEENEFAVENLQSGSTLLFGRVTYEMMAGYWPTPVAIKIDSVMAEGMNKADKIVFSRTLKKAGWNNTKLIKDNMVEEIKKLKQLPGKDMTVLGSGSIITQLADKGLIDEYQVMLNPVAIGEGTALLNNIRHPLDLKLINTRIFKNSGAILLCYQPVKN
jgi:dihydrofolate reductase